MNMFLKVPSTFLLPLRDSSLLVLNICTKVYRVLVSCILLSYRLVCVVSAYKYSHKYVRFNLILKCFLYCFILLLNWVNHRVAIYLTSNWQWSWYSLDDTFSLECALSYQTITVETFYNIVSFLCEKIMHRTCYIIELFTVMNIPRLLFEKKCFRLKQYDNIFNNETKFIIAVFIS